MGGNHHIFSLKKAGRLDSRLRRLLQNPRRLLAHQVTAGMTVMDVGCGPGFFTMELARMVGDTGKVIAADLQEGMLTILNEKIKKAGWEKRVRLHQCEAERLGITVTVDFMLAFNVVHEFPQQEKFFSEAKSLLKPDAKLFLAEPKIRVSQAMFEETIQKARDAGLTPVARPSVLLGRAVILANS